MLALLKDWPGIIEINGIQQDASQLRSAEFSGDIHIKLYPKQRRVAQTIQETADNSEYKVTVRQYMTQKSTPEFDFMARWNKDNPMPLRTMVGTIEKETRGMVYMKLHGQAEPVIHCMRCGRLLTNPISQHYGIGPECMAKLGFVCDIDDISTIKKKLVEVTWEGWIIRSAITHWEEL